MVTGCRLDRGTGVGLCFRGDANGDNGFLTVVGDMDGRPKRRIDDCISCD